jgi:outer membrane receptor protein involved in Fe transport
MDTRDLHRKSVLSDGVHATLTGKAAMFGAPFAIACNACIPPALAQDQDTSDQPSRNSQEAGEEAIEEIIVHGRVTLRHNEAFSATKMNMDLKDIAQSVSVITEDLIEMADVQKFQDIYRVDASAGTSNRLDDFPTNFFRGFTIQGNNAIRVDGFRFPGNVELDLATFERFELVKGPTSALFGQNSVGGTINAVTKQPTATRVGQIGLEAGSFDSYRADVDFGGALSADGRWQSRLIGVYRTSDTYINFSSDEAWIIAPSIAYDVTDNTRIVATLNYQDHHDSAQWGTGLQEYAPGEYRLLPTYRAHNFGQAWNDRNIDVVLGTVKFETDFDNGWTLRINAQSSSVDKIAYQCSGDGNADADGVIPIGCYTYYSDDNDDLWGGEVNLIGEFSLLGRQHTLFVGADYANVSSKERFGFDYIDDNGNGVYVYYQGGGVGYRLLPETAVHSRFNVEDLYYFYDSIQETAYAGVSLQALLNPTDNLQVLLSGRFTFDDAIERSGRGGTYDELDGLSYNRQTGREHSTHEFVPQIGVTYRVNDAVNVYANWGETYDPDTSFDRLFVPGIPGGTPLPPEKGKQVEVGLKADIFNDQANLTAAIFDMERSGISGSDKENLGFNLPIGAQQVKGAEFSINGNVTEAFDVYWSVAYLDAEYTKGDEGGDDVAPAGARPVNTPRFASSLFANYAILGGRFEGVGFGIGWVYKDLYEGWGRVFNGGDAAGGIAFDTGDINEVDVRIHYETDNWKYYLSVSDIGDSTYYSPVRADYRWGLSVNPGRRFLAGVKYRF